MKTSKRKYFEACMIQSARYLKLTLTDPSPMMTKVHILLIRLAIRKKELN